MAPQSPSRIVGYSGFIPGEQHLHGETYGSSAGPSLRERADANNRGAFLKKSDVRPWTKNEVTLAVQTRHLPGYSGHIPGLDAGLSKTFGASTSGSLQKEAKNISAYDGKSESLAKSMLPRELGLPHGQGWGNRAVSAPLAEPKVPGYKGFVPGRQHIYANTFGHTTSKLLEAHQTNKQDKNRFLGHSDSRPGTKRDITTTDSSNHIPGYAGHIPGLDAGGGATFGDATSSQLIDLAASITANGSSKPMDKIPFASIPRERGAPRKGIIGPSPRAAPPGTKEAAVEKRVPGYTGFQAGSQHVFGETYGRMTGSLRTAHQGSPGNKNMFLNYEENRGGNKEHITLEPSSRNAVTDTSSRSHLPGYAGHCPAQREAIGKRFGVATADSLYNKSKDAVWYGGQNSPSVAKSMLPQQMGRPRETGANVADADLSANRLPGYTGFIKHSKDTFAKTYGETTRRLANAPAKMDFTTNIGRPFGDWVLAGNNKGTHHLPGYAGHVPGYRDRPVGSTFGDSTRTSIFNNDDKAYRLNSSHVPASMYHSGLRMSEQKKKLARSAVKLGTNQWNHELTTTGAVFSRGLHMP